jgi:hypothetical protein
MSSRTSTVSLSGVGTSVPMRTPLFVQTLTQGDEFATSARTRERVLTCPRRWPTLRTWSPLRHRLQLRRRVPLTGLHPLQHLCRICPRDLSQTVASASKSVAPGRPGSSFPLPLWRSWGACWSNTSPAVPVVRAAPAKSTQSPTRLLRPAALRPRARRLLVVRRDRPRRRLRRPAQAQGKRHPPRHR